MKKSIIRLKPGIVKVSAVILTVIVFSCTYNREDPYKRLMRHMDGIKIIDTHEHQRNASDFNISEFNLYNLISHSYLNADLISAGSPTINDEIANKYSLDSLWSIYGKYLDYSVNTSYYQHFISGLRKLYGFDAPAFTKENIGYLSEEIKKNYSDYTRWFREGCKIAGIETMLVDQYWNPFNCKVDTGIISLVFNINNLVSGISRGSQKKIRTGSRLHAYYEEAVKENYTINTLDEYLLFADHLFKKNLENHAVAVKNTLAYSRSLGFEDVSYEKAVELFSRAPDISGSERKALEDFMFHWIIKKSIEYNLPVQIHTGYLAGNNNTLSNGDPMQLNNLFLQYPRAKFILFHGGYPWTSQFVALGKMFPNVYLDLVWLPQISKQSAISTLDEMLDCVPYNKIFFGGDCLFIEEAAGAIEFGKECVAGVLADRIRRGVISEQTAVKVADRIFRENAIDVFRLDEKMNIR